MCSLEVLDDVAEPQMEGNETFLVFLSSPVGSVLTEPRLALIIINDTISDGETTQQTQNICITFIQCWTNVEDVV